MKTGAVVWAMACIAFASPAAAELKERRTTLSDQTGVAVTIYNDDLALVKDRRKVVLDRGEGLLAFREVSARMRPETALLRTPSDPAGVAVREQNFDFDLLTPETLLQKYVGRTVRVVKVHPTTGAETEIEAQVLAASNGVVLQVGDRIETGVPGRIVYPDVPETLRDRPTLVLDLVSASAGEREVELSYLTGGLSWKADYVAELAPGGGSLDLCGWVTLTNGSGTAYPNAQLQFVAGDVHRVQEEMTFKRDLARHEMAMAAPAPAMRQEALFEYHLYTLERPTTLKENQTKQVALLGAEKVPVKREFRLQGQDFYYRDRFGDLGEKLKVAVFLQFENREKSGLGMPLPKGIVRVYQRDKSGAAQFVGEDRIDHTPKNETVRLKLGEAFDVTAERRQTDFRRISASEKEGYVYESAYRIELKNAKKEGVTVKVVEPVPGDWKMLKESHPHAKGDAQNAVWEVLVPADGSAVLEYRVRVKL